MQETGGIETPVLRIGLRAGGTHCPARMISSRIERSGGSEITATSDARSGADRFYVEGLPAGVALSTDIHFFPRGILINGDRIARRAGAALDFERRPHEQELVHPVFQKL